MSRRNHWLLLLLTAAVLAAVALVVWQRLLAGPDDSGLASGNGRIEAVEINVATRNPGRLEEVRVREGEFVTAGQVLASMAADTIEAQRRQAEAQLQQARSAVVTASSQVAQRRSDKAAALAVVAQREADVGAARAHLSKSEDLARQSFLSPQALDDERTRVASAQAALAAARAQAAAVDAAIASALAQVSGAESSAAAAKANLEKIQADIDDMALKSPRDGRVQFIVAQAGEVLGAGGRVLSLVDLSDVYMTFFLPTAVAGGLAIGSEVRIVLDVAPQYVIPAQVSFVADVAQFTPKTVETASEREKLMFRVRAQLPPALLKQHLVKVKTGLPGVAYVLTDPAAAWPDRLQVKLPQ
jgi:HlyD family secretion protein